MLTEETIIDLAKRNGLKASDERIIQFARQLQMRVLDDAMRECAELSVRLTAQGKAGQGKGALEAAHSVHFISTRLLKAIGY